MINQNVSWNSLILNDMRWFFSQQLVTNISVYSVQSDRTNESIEIGQTNVFFLWNIDINGPLWNSITPRKP